MPRKISTDEFKKWLNENRPEITLIGEYVTRHTKILFQCHRKHQWLSTPGNIKNGNCCPRCVGHYKPTTGEFQKWLDVNGTGLKIIDEYISNKKNTEFECDKGHIWITKPEKIKNAGHRCPRCSGRHQPTTDEFNQWLKETDKSITLIGEYVSNKVKTTFKCCHGHTWKTRPNNIKNGDGCPTCCSYGFDPEKPAWEYVFMRDDYIKFGISNNLEYRLRQHLRRGEVKVVHTKYHSYGQNAQNWEFIIKQKFRGRYVNKEKCPDGWTETLPISLLEEVVKQSEILEGKLKND